MEYLESVRGLPVSVTVAENAPILVVESVTRYMADSVAQLVAENIDDRIVGLVTEPVAQLVADSPLVAHLSNADRRLH